MEGGEKCLETIPIRNKIVCFRSHGPAAGLL